MSLAIKWLIVQYMGWKSQKMNGHATHLPITILVDRVKYALRTPYRADLKGSDEQYFRTVNTNALPFFWEKDLPDISAQGP